MNHKQAVKYDRFNPFQATLKKRFILNKPGGTRHTWHVVLSLGEGHISYRPGDSFGILPKNDPELVQKTLSCLNATGHETVIDQKGQACSFCEFLVQKANLANPSKRLLSAIIEQLSSSEKKSFLQELLQHDERLHSYLHTYNVPELLEAYPSALSIEVFVKNVAPLLPRLYSVASSPLLFPHEVHCAVSEVVYEVDGKTRRGVCSHFLCNLIKEGDTVPIYVQPTKDFLLPEDANRKVIMIGPGTGIAPFVAFMQQRLVLRSKPETNWLFFGERNRKSDFFYEEFFKELESEGMLRLDLAFSRDQAEKVYVQHKLWEKRELIWSWLQEDAIFYVCGDASRMAKDVDRVLHEIVADACKLSEHDTKEYIRTLRLEKRYIRDVY
jgi:sulfite reductase (NADPH) flavoprotein alpha-component